MKRLYSSHIFAAFCVASTACGYLGVSIDPQLDGDGDEGLSGDGDVVGDGDVGDGDVVGDGDGDLGGMPGDGDGDGEGMGGLNATGGTDGTGGTNAAGGSSGTGGTDPSIPTCEILAPADQSRIPYFGGLSEIGGFTGIQFTAKARDLEDGELSGESVVWRMAGSDEIIGQGLSFVLEQLPPGDNKVVCFAIDSDQNQGLDYVHLTSLSPVVYITHPGPDVGVVRPAGGEILFSAVGYDFEEGELDPGTFTWVSSLDGEMGMGDGGYSLMNAGEHVIVVTATDADKNEAKASVVVPITQVIDIAN